VRCSKLFLSLALVACGARTELVAPSGASTVGRQLALGNEHSCLRVNGEVRCWGENRHGELGDGTITSRATPARVAALETAQSVASGEAFDIADVASRPLRGSHTCAVLADATLACWGSNVEGYADEIDPIATPSPKPMGMSNVTRVAVGGFESCTIDASGGAACWGYDVDGALGDGSFGGSTPRGPVSVAGLSNLVEIAAGEDSACAARADGTVWCWGDDSIGELGDGRDGEGTKSAAPVRVEIEHVVHLAAGWGSFCAVRDDERAMCWGANAAGQVGDGSVSDHVTTPHEVALAGVTQIVTSGAHACALRSDRTLWCWGTAANGDLGIGPAAPIVPLPTKVALDAVVEVAAGFHHTCARTADESIWCWGMNQSGEVGDGTLDDRDVPTRVVGLP